MIINDGILLMILYNIYIFKATFNESHERHKYDLQLPRSLVHATGNKHKMHLPKATLLFLLTVSPHDSQLQDKPRI